MKFMLLKNINITGKLQDNKINQILHTNKKNIGLIAVIVEKNIKKDNVQLTGSNVGNVRS